MRIDMRPEFTLDDGRSVGLRPIEPRDEHEVTRFLETLTAEGRMARFHQPVPVVKPWLVRPLVDVDQVRHVAWMATLDDRCIGEARYVRLRSDPSTAEIAFAVADDVRRVGLGRLLVETIGVVARADGVGSFVSNVSHGNRGSAGLLTALGTRFTFGSDALQGRGPVPPWRGSSEMAHAIVRAHATVRDQFLDAAA